MYLHTIHDILPFLHKLFNEIFYFANFPSDWGHSIITPLHKKGSLTDPNNYRGISLIDSICKIFMHVLSSRISNWCDSNFVIDEAQAGFRKNYSTVDNIFVLMSLVQKYLSKKRGRFYCIFIDFKKAFDNVRHDKLWDAMERKGISGKFLNCNKSIYTKLKSCIKIDGKLTKYFDCTIGTRQGCVGSPKIFSLFINDLVSYINSDNERGIFVSKEIKDLNVLMFADDVSSFADTIIQLQRQINNIEQFSKGVGLDINLDKTKIVVFRNGGVVKQTEKWYYNNNVIDIVPCYKYLGVYFTSTMSWSKTHTVLSMQAKKAINYILRLRKHFGNINISDMLKMFDTSVKPILCYGSQIWGYQYVDKIEKVHIQFCKKICYLSLNTCDSFALGECGRLPLCTTYMPNCIKYWLGLIRMENNRYPKQCYYMLYQLDEAGRQNWVSHVKELLYTYGFGLVWILHDVGNDKEFLKLFKKRIMDCYKQKWYAYIRDTPKSIHYRHFKSLLEPEFYLNVDLPHTFKSTLANFRCSSHDLMIEKGRHLSIDREFRFCQICQKQNILVIEDEFHFIFQCSIYEDLRKEHFKKYWLKNRTLQCLYSILSCDSELVVHKISKYLFKAFQLRNDILQELS